MQSIAEAGPSHLTYEPEGTTNASTAPLRPLPSTAFYSIEYPGYVQPSSVPLAVDRLGGQGSIDAAFKRSGGKAASLLELHLQPGNPFAHPVAGEVVATNNILLKVTKRKRKWEEQEPLGNIGEYTIDAVGVVPKTARFRSECTVRLKPVPSDANGRQVWPTTSSDSTGKTAYRGCDMQWILWMVNSSAHR